MGGAGGPTARVAECAMPRAAIVAREVAGDDGVEPVGGLLERGVGEGGIDESGSGTEAGGHQVLWLAGWVMAEQLGRGERCCATGGPRPARSRRQAPPRCRGQRTEPHHSGWAPRRCVAEPRPKRGDACWGSRGTTQKFASPFSTSATLPPHCAHPTRAASQ